MSISYILTTDEMALIVHFLGYEQLPAFEKSFNFSEEKVNQILKELSDKGMITQREDTVLIDPVLAFVLKAVMSPELVIKGIGGQIAYLNEELGLILKPDRLAKDKYMLTPIPDGERLASQLWESSGSCFDVCFFQFLEDTKNWTRRELTQQELTEEVCNIYKGEKE